MKYFAGLDVSLEATAICVVDETGRIVREVRTASEPQALSEALRNVQLPLERIGLEACSLTAWLHDELRACGLAVICIETRAANASMKAMPNKTDRNDARALAQIMRTGWYRQVHVKSCQCRLWRSLLVARRTVVNEMRTIENVVRAILREAGIKLGTPSRTAFAGRVRDLVGEAAHSLLVRSKKWSSLRAWGMTIARRRGMARARVAVARKLAVILHRMWVDVSEFRYGREPAGTAA